MYPNSRSQHLPISYLTSPGAGQEDSGSGDGSTTDDTGPKCTVPTVQDATLGNTHNLGDEMTEGTTFDVTCNSGLVERGRRQLSSFKGTFGNGKKQLGVGKMFLSQDNRIMARLFFHFVTDNGENSPKLLKEKQIWTVFVTH